MEKTTRDVLENLRKK